LLEAACWEDVDADGTDTITAPGLTTAIIRKGDLAADLNIGAGGTTTLMVTGGSLTGNITDAGALTTLLVSGGGISGNVSAARVGMVMVTGGDMSGSITSTESAAQLGALTGIGTVMVNGGDLSGDLTSNGNVSTISVTRNALTGHGGNVSGAFNLGGGLLSLTLTGGDLSGALNVGGSLGMLSLNKSGANGGNVLAGAVVNAGVIGSLRAGGSFQGASGNGITVNAGQITGLNVAGDMDYTALTLANAARKATVAALGTMSVGGNMANSQLLSDGNLTSVTLGGMDDSEAFAGVASSVTGLPGAEADFSGQDSIGTFTILGLKSGTTPITSLINSNIAAWKLGTASLAYAQGDNGGVPFGVACNQYATLTYRPLIGSTTTWTKSNPAASLSGPDGVVRVITS